VPLAWTKFSSHTGSFAEVEADQETDDPYDHEAEPDEVKFTDVLSKTLPLARVEVKEEEQKETCNSASWPGISLTNPWRNTKQRTHRLTKKHHLQDT
jgi:hypothetical protein